MRFVENNLSCGEIWDLYAWEMWQNLKFLHMWSNFKFLHMTDVEKFEVSSQLACVWCGECLKMCTRYAVLLKIWFCRDLRCLSRNLFWRDVRTFVWRKIKPKIAYVEKKWQIWGMVPSWNYCLHVPFTHFSNIVILKIYRFCSSSSVKCQR